MSESLIRLRPITEADLPDYVVWLNDPEVTQFLTIEAGKATLEGEREWLARISAGGREKIWAIEVEGRHIGNCSLDPICGLEKRIGSFGIMIGDKSAWNKGYGTAALQQVLKYGFEEMGLYRIFLDVMPQNRRGIRCYEKCGLRYEGTQRQSFFKNGQWVDVGRMAILLPEWQAQQMGLAPEQLLDSNGVSEWLNYIVALRPVSGEIIVDAGCRAATRSMLLAPYVMPAGKILGFDITADDVAKAVASIAEKGLQDTVSAQVADIRSLPLQDDVADAWFCREVLEYLDNPQVALAEAVRVVKPGGRVVVMEADWDTLIYNTADKELERKFVARNTDCGGGWSMDGRTGRKLVYLFKEAGLQDVQLAVHTIWSDKYFEDSYLCRPLGDGAVERGCISREDREAFYADLKSQAERGRYFHCYTYFICSGEVK